MLIGGGILPVINSFGLRYEKTHKTIPTHWKRGITGNELDMVCFL
jgi:hypothetical protein